MGQKVHAETKVMILYIQRLGIYEFSQRLLTPRTEHSKSCARRPAYGTTDGILEKLKFKNSHMSNTK